MIGSRAYNELVGRIEKIEAAIASLPEKGRAWNKEYINDEWMDGEQVCRYLGISGRTLQRLRSDHVITCSTINRKLYYSLTEIRRVLKERSPVGLYHPERLVEHSRFDKSGFGQ